jgi:hypothetical protein
MINRVCAKNYWTPAFLSEVELKKPTFLVIRAALEEIKKGDEKADISDAWPNLRADELGIGNQTTM